MHELFPYALDGWASWSRVFGSPECFTPLARCLFEREHLPFTALEPCRPGTNAVFRSGAYIVKIYAPAEAGVDFRTDFETELSGLRNAAQNGIPVPEVVAVGAIEDRQLFRYLILRRIEGVPFGDIRDSLGIREKRNAAREIRSFVDRLHALPPPEGKPEVRSAARSNERWRLFPEPFRREHADYLANLPALPRRFVHGDLTADNVLMTPERKLFLIDFADAVAAPPEYELPPIVCDLFAFEPPLLEAFFDQQSAEELAGQCVRGLLLHDFGANIIQDALGDPAAFTGIGVLRKRLTEKFISVFSPG